MDAGRWKEPITFETAVLGRYRTVTSTEEAARILLEDWPGRRGKAFLRAKVACLSVLTGDQPPETARRAFLEAAAKGGVFIRMQG
jgi:hypothetical protein